jgi:hypothetical protein
MEMVDTLLLVFMQLAHKLNKGGSKIAPRGIAMMVNTMQQRKHTNNKIKRGWVRLVHLQK